MYNFLDSKLSPKVTTSTPSIDNYEIENLISENYGTRARGFLAYSVVKPPVEVIFELICPINVHYIILTTSLNNQKHVTIELFTKNHNRDFTSIAYCRFNTVGVIFCNNRMYSVDNPPPNIDRSYQLSYFKSGAFRSFMTANCVKVCILKTDGSVPCLGKVEIWGKPSKTCSLTTVNTINRLMQGPIQSNDTSTINKPAITLDNLEIPEEFKDALTFEVMSLPTTLPSGNTIDQSTLEKCTENDASYGRLPTDPFTGQQFTETRKPVFNAALKQRIDMFLLQNSNKKETFTIKRTVGTTKIKQKVENTYSKNAKLIKYSTENENTDKPIDSDQKLDEAINKILNSGNFICFTKDASASKEEPPKCSGCKLASNLYIIPCKHFCCKKCLLTTNDDLKCGECEIHFCRSDPIKFHS